jgi:hypothetical protein
MATISNSPKPGYAWDATDNVWYPIGTGAHGHPDYITQATAINPSTVTTKGDLLVATGAGTVVRQGVGSDGQVLVADSAQADGVNWVTPTAGGITQIATTTATASASITFSSIPATYRNLYIVAQNFIPSTNGDRLQMRFNGVTSGTYKMSETYGEQTDQNIAETSIEVSAGIRNSSATGMGYIFIPNYSTTTSTKITNCFTFFASSLTAGRVSSRTNTGYFNSTSAISSITFLSSAATFSGVFTLYGVS